MSKKLTIMAGTMLGLVTIATPAAAQQIPAATIAIVDTDRIFAECTACVAANAQIQAQAQALQTRQQTLAQPLQTEGQAIQQAVAALNGAAPDPALTARAQAYETNAQNAQRELTTQQQQIQRNIGYVRQQIGAQLNPIITQQMQARGANLAMDTGATFAHSPSLDITANVLTALNAALPTVSVIAPPPPAAATPAPSTEGR